jgi:hypothetical protein
MRPDNRAPITGVSTGIGAGIPHQSYQAGAPEVVPDINGPRASELAANLSGCSEVSANRL